MGVTRLLGQYCRRLEYDDKTAWDFVVTGTLFSGWNQRTRHKVRTELGGKSAALLLEDRCSWGYGILSHWLCCRFQQMSRLDSSGTVEVEDADFKKLVPKFVMHLMCPSPVSNFHGHSTGSALRQWWGQTAGSPATPWAACWFPPAAELSALGMEAMGISQRWHGLNGWSSGKMGVTGVRWNWKLRILVKIVHIHPHSGDQ